MSSISDNYLGAISQEIPQPSITKIGWKNFILNFPGANEPKAMYYNMILYIAAVKHLTI